MAHLEKCKHQFNDQQQLDRSKLTVDNLPQDVCLASWREKKLTEYDEMMFTSDKQFKL